MWVDDRGRTNVEGAAKALGVHPNTVRNWCRQGFIKYETLPNSGYRRIPVSEVRRLTGLVRRD